MPVAGTFAAASARGFGFGTEDMFGEQIFSSPGTYTFYVPPGVTSISVVSIGGGGGSARGARYTNFEDPNSITPYTPPGSLTANFYAGGGGGLAYKNSISVTPGQPITVFVGAGGSSSSASDNPGQESYIATAAGTKLVRAGGGNAGTSGAGGTMLLGDGGGSGGAGANWLYSGSSVPAEKVFRGGGGGGAGGYTGNGGAGGNGTDGSAGSGGGGGGGGGGRFGSFTTGSGTIEYVYGYGAGAGGGTGLFGLGSSGAGGLQTSTPFTTGSYAEGGGGGSGGGAGNYGYGGDGGDNSGGGYGSYGGGGGAPGSYTRYDTIDASFICSARFAGEGGDGAVRIIWTTNPTITRSFPSTNVGQL